jgi:ABC-type multidrug transport system permease subunit
MTLAPVVLSTVIAATCFGIFLISLVKTERQAGGLIGGGVSVLGMLGMMPIFVLDMPNPPQFVFTASQFVPQGWAVQGLRTAMEGGTPAEVAGVSLALLLWAAVFFVIGIARFRGRFA